MTVALVVIIFELTDGLECANNMQHAIRNTHHGWTRGRAVLGAVAPRAARQSRLQARARPGVGTCARAQVYPADDARSDCLEVYRGCDRAALDLRGAYQSEGVRTALGSTRLRPSEWAEAELCTL